jgi:signal peptidase I
MNTEVSKAQAGLYDLLESIVTAVITAVLIFTFIGRLNGVEGPSMQRTLWEGDRIILSNLFYTPKYGDVVFIKTGYDEDQPLVKRVIATAGQQVNINFVEGVVYVDGKALEEPYTPEPTYLMEDFSGPVTVPEGCIFVMGDNRNQSLDSRDDRVGFIDLRDVLGRVYLIVLPGVDDSGTRDWSRFGPVR